MKIGVLVRQGDDMDKEFKKVRDFGFDNCQMKCWYPETFTEENAKRIKADAEKNGVEISAFWCGWTGPNAWNFYDGPHTLGIVPPEYRETRCNELMKGSDYAKMLGVKNIVTHLGFMPEVPTTTEWHKICYAVKELADHAKENGQNFLLETGQETPVTLLRLMEDTGCENLGINLDPANLILYGKANPVDALDVIGNKVMGVHAKDGLYPTCGRELGKEVKLGDGKVNFPLFIKRLKECGYDGPLTIEREIEGDEQIKDIKYAKTFLEGIL